MQRNSSKNRWMVILMVSSQLLLTGFISYWLINQYQDEKRELHTKLMHEYLTTHDQLIDSILLKDLINPTLDDSLITGKQEIMMKQVRLDSTPERQVYAVHLGDGYSWDSICVDSSSLSASVDPEMMVRSVKLFINHTDESFRADPTAHVFSMQIDSSAFHMELDERFKNLGWKFFLEPMDRNITGADMKLHHGLALMNSTEAIPPFFVKKYSGYVLRSMFPQFLFALILLSLSASAFLMVYRSLKKQIILHRMRDDFIGNISHELKTPVSTVKVALEALRTFDLNKDAKVSAEYLEMASRETERLEGLVGKVLDHQILEDPSVLLKKENCDLLDMVRRVIRTLDLPIREKVADIHVEETDNPCRVRVDHVYVEGVLINLIDNSLKYAGPRPKIKIRISCDESGTSLSVEDNGPGIPHEFRSQVFQKFFRIPAGDLHNVKGYGLGLNFAAQVMEHHGGSISVKNLDDGGCMFTLYFPNITE